MVMTSDNNHADGLPHSGAVLSWKPGHGGNATELISVSKDNQSKYEIPEITLKTILDNNDEAIDFAQAIHHCIEFNMTSMLKELYTLLALKASVKGLARQQFLSGITGVMWDFNSKKPLFNSNRNENKKDKRE